MKPDRAGRTIRSINIKLPEQLLEAVQKSLYANGQTVSGFVRDAMGSYVMKSRRVKITADGGNVLSDLRPKIGDLYVADGKMYRKTKTGFKVVVSPELEAPNA